jgi:hypothetical protein
MLEVQFKWGTGFIQVSHFVLYDYIFTMLLIEKHDKE